MLALPIRTWHSSAAQEGPRAQPLREIPAALPGSTNLPFASSTKPRGLQLAPKVGRARQLGLRTRHPPCTAHAARVLPPQGPVISLLGAAGAPSAARHARSGPRSSRGLASTLVQVRERAGPGAHRQARAWPLSAGGSGTPRVDSTPLAGGGQGLGGCCPGAAPTPPKPRRLAFAVPAPTLSGCEITKKVGRKGREKGTARRE